MITIRREQMAALAKAASGPFIERVAADLRELFPERCDELGPSGVRALVESGIEKGYRYGMTREDEIAQLAGLLVLLGPDFDVDPDFEWAHRILKNSSKPAQDRLDALYLLA